MRVGVWQGVIVISVFITAIFKWISPSYDISLADFDFTEKAVLITGGSKNIGEELAYQLAREGANIVVTARNVTSLTKVVSNCKKYGASSAYYVLGDMNNIQDTKRVIENSVKLLGGKLDFLFLNHVAGLETRDYFKRWKGDKEQDLNSITKATNINFLSYVYLATYAHPYLHETSGYLSVVSSLSGLVPAPNVTAYGTTKAAVNHFFHTLHIERFLYEKGQSYSITISSLGPVDTIVSGGPSTYKHNFAKLPVNDTAREIILATINRSFHAFVPHYWIYSTSLVQTIPYHWRNLFYSLWL